MVSFVWSFEMPKRNCLEIQMKTALKFKWFAGNDESGQRISLWRDSRVNVLTSEHQRLTWNLPKMKQGFRSEIMQVGDYLKMLGQKTYFSIHGVRKKSGGKRFRLLTSVLLKQPEKTDSSLLQSMLCPT